MTEEEKNKFKSFRQAWIVAEPPPPGEDDDYEEGPELAACLMTFEHAGRYSMKFGNQGFDVSGFEEVSRDDDGIETCEMWRYASSDDVAYYDGEFKSESRLAYDVALWANVTRNLDGWNRMSECMADLFKLIVKNDVDGIAAWAKRYSAAIEPSGRVELECYDNFDLVLTATFEPRV